MDNKTQAKIDGDIAQFKADILRAKEAGDLNKHTNPGDVEKQQPYVQETHKQVEISPEVESPVPTKNAPIVKNESDSHSKDNGDSAHIETRTNKILTFEEIQLKTQKKIKKNTEDDEVSSGSFSNDQVPQIDEAVLTQPRKAVEKESDEYTRSADRIEKNTEARIPSFNLADQILSQQRKVAASNRRKPPAGNSPRNIPMPAGTIGKIIAESKKSQLGTKAKSEIPEMPLPAVFKIPDTRTKFNTESDDIIMDIVARDIMCLCGNRYTDSTRYSYVNN